MFFEKGFGGVDFDRGGAEEELRAVFRYEGAVYFLAQEHFF